MAYEVTKKIKGRDYRYRVEGVRDPATGRTRTRWQYLGRLDGEDLIAPARVSAPRVTRDELVAVTAKLLETRDASRVTVSVIAHHAGVSSGTFYRHFHDRRSALSAAVAHVIEDLLHELPSLEGDIGTRAAERDRLFAWFSSLQGAALHGRALRWFLTQADREITKAMGDSAVADEPRRILAAYLQRLHRSGRARIDDPDALATALVRMHFSVVRDMAFSDDAADAASRWAAVFPVIERAVFPHERAAA